MDEIINRLLVEHRHDAKSVTDIELFKCIRCQRGFNSVRGLSVHSRTCEKRLEQSSSQPNASSSDATIVQSLFISTQPAALKLPGAQNKDEDV